MISADDLDPILEAVEKRLLELSMKKAGKNSTKAAELLGIWRSRHGFEADELEEIKEIKKIILSKILSSLLIDNVESQNHDS